MNYKKIYYDLCEYCRTIPIKIRLEKRNKNDDRINLNENKIYTEMHHIIPKHEGGTNDKENLVELLPEEHYMAHLIRWKAYNSRNDFLAVRYIVNGYNSNHTTKFLYESANCIKNIRQRCAHYKQHIYNFKKNNNWHSDEGVQRISESRKNKFPAVDMKTGLSVGSVDKNHPKILSGEWVHHSKGKKSVIHKISGEKLYINVNDYNPDIHAQNVGLNKNEKNGNFKELTVEFKNILFDNVRNASENNHIHKSNFIKIIAPLSENYYYKRISEAFINNKFGNFASFIEEYNKERNDNVVYNPYYRKFSSQISTYNVNKNKNN
jgi:hypothetical protein